MALGPPHGERLELTGESLAPPDLVHISRGGVELDLSAEAWERVARGRQVIDSILAKGEVAYGINTGFGLFSEVVVPPEKLGELQENLIRSHAAGVGEPLSRERTRMLLALRANVLAKGHSGVRTETLRKYLAAFNKDCLSAVPCKGTVGASGDLAPLAHLALGLMGEGRMWDPATGRLVEDAGAVLRASGLEPIVLGAKEGLALINGTQLITALGAEAVVRAGNAARCADLACALTLEVLKGTSNAFHQAIHDARPHAGQRQTAARLRALLLPRSNIFHGHKYRGRVQDAYCLRCAPQVHGVVHDTVAFVEGILATEMNSATDNPMVFTGDTTLPDEAPAVEAPAVEVLAPLSGLGGSFELHGSPRSRPPAEAFPAPGGEPTGGAPPGADAAPGGGPAAAGRAAAEREALLVDEIRRLRAALAGTQRKDERCTFYRGPGGFVISGGNFHGEYPAKALDYLAIGVQELANISERRIERMVNPQLSGLPAFLVREGGLNSGFMVAHCTAAACTSENKVLVHPASADTISTSGAKEDHVSMGGFAARKALDVVENVETVLAIEVLAACQAMEFFRPARSTPVLEAVHALVRRHVRPWDQDRAMYADIERAVALLRSGELWAAAAALLEEPGAPTVGGEERLQQPGPSPKRARAGSGQGA